MCGKILRRGGLQNARRPTAGCFSWVFLLIETVIIFYDNKKRETKLIVSLV